MAGTLIDLFKILWSEASILYTRGTAESISFLLWIWFLFYTFFAGNSGANCYNKTIFSEKMSPHKVKLRYEIFFSRTSCHKGKNCNWLRFSSQTGCHHIRGIFSTWLICADIGPHLRKEVVLLLFCSHEHVARVWNEERLTALSLFMWSCRSCWVVLTHCK